MILAQASLTICGLLINIFQVKKIGSIILLIWVLAILAILPTTFATGLIGITFAETNLIMSEVCAEKWPFPFIHLIYSVLLMVVQVNHYF
jgi:hypothetical protein